MVDIPGLTYISNYISPANAKSLLEVVDQQPWLNELKRRVQHYGYRYDYKKHAVGSEMYLGKLPEWTMPLVEQLHNENFIGDIPDQIIINEYQPGQGISSHIDCIPCFGDTILSLSLGSPCIMVFTQIGSDLAIPVLLEPGSLVVMKDQARFNWKHGIPSRKTDNYQGRTILRGHRISVTCRKVINQGS